MGIGQFHTLSGRPVQFWQLNEIATVAASALQQQQQQQQLLLLLLLLLLLQQYYITVLLVRETVAREAAESGSKHY